ncbi:MlaC/ttg2D family ABC transporter substrate-binding protein [Neptunicella marina]|uniref:ABC transporter substrate-binding protein n=1 Tax=Neptunicella marina TaxID=2125989 RepID=A0A8J6LYU2_9ALTE|nr:ABC transporter substrate-binding protein [Neptunicella marina]MBC3765635.1 ABC transporter substrate-binding protein [Neptunicella marina]
MFKKLLFGMAVVVSALPALAKPVEVDLTNPYAMVNQVATNTFERIKSEKKDIATNPEVLKQIVSDELMPYVDANYAALKVLGKYYRNYPKEKVYEYINEFKPYIVATYANALAYYEDQKVIIEPAHDIGDQKQVNVKALVQDPGKPDVNLTFVVRKDSRSGEWRAYDMVVEGISLVSSKQSEFESILRQQGIDTVIALMKDKSTQKVSVGN